VANGRPGRPSKFTPERRAEAIRLAGLLWSLETIAKRIGVGLRTLKQWSADDPDFRTELMRARGESLNEHVEQIRAIAKSGDPKHAIRLDAARWILSRRANDDWGRKLDPDGKADAPKDGPPAVVKLELTDRRADLRDAASGDDAGEPDAG
tara:strand:- start:577 stop:1029 length:453 start_codon:yes stop_codon:yes gene_type:complete